MEDFPGPLPRDFRFRSQGKSAPMKSSSSSFLGSGSNSAQSNNHPVSSFDDVFGGPPKRTNQKVQNQHPSFDSIFDDPNPNPKSKYSSMPVYDKPVYDDDIFDGVPGIKSSAAANVEYEDVFASISKGGCVEKSGTYDILENLGRSSSERREAKRSENLGGFEELTPVFGGSRPPSRRDPPETNRQESEVLCNKPTATIPEDPFVVLETTSTSAYPSSGMFPDPSQKLNSPMNSGSAIGDASSPSGAVFDDIDVFDGLGKSVPASTSEKNESRKDKSHLKSVPNRTQERSYLESFDNAIPKSRSVNPFDSRSSTRNPKSNDSPQLLETADDVWLTVSEIPLFTQPTRAPPPSRPPPPAVIKSVPYGRSDPRRKGEFFSQSSPSYSYLKGSLRRPSASNIDELEDFAMNKPQANERAAVFSSDDNIGTNSTAAATMMEAMDIAEAKFKHAKEVRERDARSARSREFAQEIDEEVTPDVQDLNDKEREEKLEQERLQWEREEREREERRLQKERELERERSRQAVERATREARERAAAEARVRAERAAVEKANTEVRQRAEKAAFQRAAAEARERASRKAAADAREKAARERAAAESRLRAERVAVDRAHAEAQERAAAAAREKQYKTENDLESFFGLGGRPNNASKQRATTSPPSRGSADGTRQTSPAASSGIRKASSTTNIVDDLSSIFGGAPSSGGEFQEIEGQSEERRRARFERHEKTLARAAQALAEKNKRDMQTQREQAERDRIGETLDIEIKRWATGKEGNLRALLSTLQYVLWPECGWQAVSLTDLITAAAVKKVYRKATLCIHPDKVQQKGANVQQKYIAEKVFDLLKEAWNKFNSEELF